MSLTYFNYFYFIVLFFTQVGCSTFQGPQPLNFNRTQSQTRTETNTKPLFEWPVEQFVITQLFNPNRHFGLDMAAPKNTPVKASHSGYVLYTGTDFRGFGKLIILETKTGWATFYAHLNQIQVFEGQTIQTGQIIGKIGQTGRATGPHLHFEIRKNKTPLNPLDHLPKLSHPQNRQLTFAQ